MLFSSDEVVATLQSGSRWAEFLLFPLRFMVHMSPPMLVPAPEGGSFSAGPFQFLPAARGKPRRNHRQTEGHPIARKEIHEPKEVGSRHSHIIGAEKNINGIKAVTLFKGGTETVVHPGGQIGRNATP